MVSLDKIMSDFPFILILKKGLFIKLCILFMTENNHINAIGDHIEDRKHWKNPQSWSDYKAKYTNILHPKLPFNQSKEGYSKRNQMRKHPIQLVSPIEALIGITGRGAGDYAGSV